MDSGRKYLFNTEIKADNLCLPDDDAVENSTTLSIPKSDAKFQWVQKASGLSDDNFCQMKKQASSFGKQLISNSTICDNALKWKATMDLEEAAKHAFQLHHSVFTGGDENDIVKHVHNLKKSIVKKENEHLRKAIRGEVRKSVAANLDMEEKEMLEIKKQRKKMQDSMIEYSKKNPDEIFNALSVKEQFQHFNFEMGSENKKEKEEEIETFATNLRTNVRKKCQNLSFEIPLSEFENEGRRTIRIRKK